MSSLSSLAPTGALTLRGRLVQWVGNPFQDGPESLLHHQDGLLHAVDGKIVHAGDAQRILAEHPELEPEPVHGILAPGFVDAHLHLPQMRILGAHGEQLLDWLERYTFPAERSFEDPQVCADSARLFVDACLQRGVTTAAAFCTVHAGSVDALFEAASARNMRMIAGKVLMDRNAPEFLRDSAQSGFDDSAALMDRWHGVGRNAYAVTPRFAPTSTPEQLEASGALFQRKPGVYLQSHVAENQAECAWVAELFPDSESYLEVYERFGLLGRRALYGHGIYLEDRDLQRLSESGAAIVHCPSSNLFLGSGLLSVERLVGHGHLALGSDIGAGTHLSPMTTLSDAYKVSSMAGAPLDAFKLWWLATAGGAEALELEGVVGNLVPGADADIVLLDGEISELHAHRLHHAQSLEEELFFLAACGEADMVARTWVAGQEV